jgi:hypothetical protein
MPRVTTVLALALLLLGGALALAGSALAAPADHSTEHVTKRVDCSYPYEDAPTLLECTTTTTTYTYTETPSGRVITSQLEQTCYVATRLGEFVFDGCYRTHVVVNPTVVHVDSRTENTTDVIDGVTHACTASSNSTETNGVTRHSESQQECDPPLPEDY